MPAVTGNQAPNHQDAVVKLRTTTSFLKLIDRAAKLADKTRTDFILESAQSCAADLFIDDLYSVGEKTRSQTFIALDEIPPTPTDRLKLLMVRKAPWER